jgi:transposase
VRKIHAAPDARLLPFAEQLTMIDQIGEDIARLKNRIESCRNAQIKQLWNEDIARLEKREKVELKALIASIRKHPDLAKRLDLINSIDGIGLPTAVDAGAHARDRPDDPGASCRARRACTL